VLSSPRRRFLIRLHVLEFNVAHDGSLLAVPPRCNRLPRPCAAPCSRISLSQLADCHLEITPYFLLNGTRFRLGYPDVPSHCWGSHWRTGILFAFPDGRYGDSETASRGAGLAGH